MSWQSFPQAEYEAYPSILPLAECFWQDIRLTYAEYQACIKSAQDYALQQEQYRFRLTNAAGFHNIQVLCREGQWCMVSEEPGTRDPFRDSTTQS